MVSFILSLLKTHKSTVVTLHVQIVNIIMCFEPSKIKVHSQCQVQHPTAVDQVNDAEVWKCLLK